MAGAPGIDEPRWQRADAVLWRRTLDGVAVARPELEGPEPVIIKGGGVAVWELLDEPHTQQALVDELAEAFGADTETVASDVAALLADLEASGYVRRS